MSSKYMQQSPFPHVVIDNFLDIDVAERIYEELLAREPDDKWYKYDNLLEFKRATDKRELIPEPIMKTLDFYNQPKALKAIEEYSGISGLIPDPYMRGGGIHMIMPGGFLDIHADRQIHPKLGLYRRLNLLIYMNKNYRHEYGGQLELWERNMSKCAGSIEPIFNRAVLFETDKTSYHGHPNPWKGPVPRISLALYYWTSSIPKDLEINDGSTDFKKRPEDPEDLDKEALREERRKARLSTNV